jgi:sulfur relay (sulfurtransferase) complex TusBCD TusD component (DsrE family)
MWGVHLQDFPTTAMTFEAWISSSDFCHAGKQQPNQQQWQQQDQHKQQQQWQQGTQTQQLSTIVCISS